MNRREIWALVAVAIWIVIVWCFLQWRSASPPPPKIVSPPVAESPAP